jgi:hypothetical protein
MSIHDMVTYRDPDTPGMAFGRPPTRPGYRRDVPGYPATTHGVAPSAVRASAASTPGGPDAASAEGPFARPDPASADGPFAGADGASADRTFGAGGTDTVAASDGVDPVGPPDGGDQLHRSESEAEVDRPETEVDRPESHVDRPGFEAEVDRPESHVDRSDSEVEVDRPETEVDRPESHVDRPGSEVEVDRPEAEIDEPESEIDEPESEIDPAGPDVVDPVVASTTAEAVDGPDGAAPVQDGREPSLGPDRVADLRRRWGAVQAGFVDDPRRAVEVADDIVAEAVSALQAAIDDRRRAVAAPWRDEPGASTDALLAAFHAYRAVFDRVLSA